MKKKPELFTEKEYEYHKVSKELAKIVLNTKYGFISALKASIKLDKLGHKIDKLNKKYGIDPFKKEKVK